MSQKNKTLRGIPYTTLRRLRYTPTYFFLIWRWTFWFYALVWIIVVPTRPKILITDSPRYHFHTILTCYSLYSSIQDIFSQFAA